MTTNKDGKVYAVGEFTSKLAASYLEHLACSPEDQQPLDQLREKLKKALDEVDLHVTAHQVSNIIKALHEHRAEKEDTDGGLAQGVTWGEFCAICVDIYSLHRHRKYDSKSDAPPTLPRPPQRNFPISLSCKHDVFLGGSCNPTTWRLDSAVPYLQQHSITYFNPQVDRWYPELIEIEEQAKDAATHLLFVVDNQTRAISSMVEIGYLTGQGRDVVSVVEDIVPGAVEIRGEPLSEREVQDLNRGRLFVRNLLEEGQASLLTDNVTHALQVIHSMRTDGCSVEHYRCSNRVSRLHPSLGEEIHLLSRVFHMYDNDKKNRLSLNELELALRSLHIEGPSLQCLLKEQQQQDGVHQLETESGSGDNVVLAQYSQHGLSFQEFCCVYAELKHGLLDLPSWTSLSRLIVAPLRWLVSWLWSPKGSPGPDTPRPYMDVFLNGSCGSTTWRTDVSIPILKQYGVSYFNPQVANWDRRLLPIEREAKDRCCVLLYVVTGDTLAVGSLVEAAYYIGKGRSIVLCVDDIHHPDSTVTIEGMKLSAGAVKDYNRGRAYLVAMANKSRVPVYSDIAAATLAAVDLALCVRGVKTHAHHRTSPYLGDSSVRGRGTSDHSSV